MSTPEEKNLLTPATTPSSVTSNGNFLAPYPHSCRPTKLPWYTHYKPPYAILSVSVLEVISHSVMKEKSKLLRFDPNRQKEVWRFFTYMLVHDSWYHLILNVVIQCLFAMHLEARQGSWRVALLYVCSGALGALGAACVEPDLVIGASAGVYALLISYVADVIVNFKTIKYRIARCVSVAVIVASDVIYNLVHFHNRFRPPISWGAHITGAISGFLIGLVLYKNYSEDEKSHSKVFFVTGLLLLSLVLIALLVINFQIKKCTHKGIIYASYTYVC